MTDPFKSFNVIVVEEGTEIEVPHPVTGQPETQIITNDDLIYVGRDCYMTQAMFDKAKENLPKVPPGMDPERPN